MLECHFSKPAKERIAQMQSVGHVGRARSSQAFIREYGAGIYLAPPNAFGWIVPYASRRLRPGRDLAVHEEVPQAETDDRPRHRSRSTTPRSPKYKDQIEKDLAEPRMIIAVTCLVAIAVIAFILGVRPKDLPGPGTRFAVPAPRRAQGRDLRESARSAVRVSPRQALRRGLPDRPRRDLQKELAAVLAEVDKLKAGLGVQVAPAGAGAEAAAPAKQPPASSAPPAARSSTRT